MNHARAPHRDYYADFEMRQALLAVGCVAFAAGVIAGLLIGWWTA